MQKEATMSMSLIDDYSEHQSNDREHQEGFEKVKKQKKKSKSVFSDDDDFLTPEEKQLEKAWKVIDLFLDMKTWCEREGIDLLDKCDSYDLFDFVFGNFPGASRN